MGPMWRGAEVTVGPKWLGPRCLGPKWLGPRWLGAEVTRGRGGSGAEVSVNLFLGASMELHSDMKLVLKAYSLDCSSFVMTACPP